MSGDYTEVPVSEDKTFMKDMFCAKDGDDWCLLELEDFKTEIFEEGTTSDRMQVSRCARVLALQ